MDDFFRFAEEISDLLVLLGNSHVRTGLTNAIHVLLEAFHQSNFCKSLLLEADTEGLGAVLTDDSLYTIFGIYRDANGNLWCTYDDETTKDDWCRDPDELSLMVHGPSLPWDKQLSTPVAPVTVLPRLIRRDGPGNDTTTYVEAQLRDANGSYWYATEYENDQELEFYPYRNPTR